MFFRFGSAIALVVLISLAGVALEKQNLEFKRKLSLQAMRTEVLLDDHAKLRCRTQEVAAPVRLLELLEKGDIQRDPSMEPTASRLSRLPLLHWQREADRVE
jgi:hypothetical protein